MEDHRIEEEDLDEVPQLMVPKTRKERKSSVREQLIRLECYFMNVVREQKVTHFGTLKSTNLSHHRRITIISFLVKECIGVMCDTRKEGQHLMMRELYYSIIAQFPKLLVQPEEIFKAINDICNHYKWERHWLPVEALTRGMYFLSEGTYLKATNAKGEDVPFLASGKEEQIPGSQTIDDLATMATNAEFLICLESQAQFNTLKNHGFFKEAKKCIGLIVRGIPGRAMRLLISTMIRLRLISDRRKIFSFVDSDGWGLYIGTLMAFGPYSPGSIQNKTNTIAPILTPIYVIAGGKGTAVCGKEKTTSDDVALEMAGTRLKLDHFKEDDEAYEIVTENVGVWKDIHKKMVESRYVAPHQFMGNLKDVLKNHELFKKENLFLGDPDQPAMETLSLSSQPTPSSSN